MKTEDLVVRIEFLNSKRGESKDTPCIGVNADGANIDQESFVYETADAFVRRVEFKLGALGLNKGEKPFLLVFGETLEDTFVPFLCGTVGRKLEKIAAELPHDAHQDNGNTKQEDDICDVVVLVCPLGDAKWYQKFLWGDEVNPAGTSKYAVRVFDGERFKELREWAKRGDFHRRDFTR
jgi:hypothetical protein|nr:hypothetical protein [Akkermansia muciniphila]